MRGHSLARGKRRFIGLVLVAVLGAIALASFPAQASRIGCTAAGYDNCSFVSPGGTIKAVGAGYWYSVTINGHSCIAGQTGPEQKSCPAPYGSTVFVNAKAGVASAILLWT